MQIDKLKHSQGIEITNIKLEAVRAKNEAGKEKDKIQGQLEGCVCKTTIHHHVKLFYQKMHNIHKEYDRRLFLGLP